MVVTEQRGASKYWAKVVISQMVDDKEVKGELEVGPFDSEPEAEDYGYSIESAVLSCSVL